MFKKRITFQLMKNRLVFFILFVSYWNMHAQITASNSNDTKYYFYSDKVVSIIKWYGDDKKIDSLKTYYTSGELNERFYFYNGRLQGKSYKYNRIGGKLTTWEFSKGKLITRTDHKIEFNKKTEEKVKKAHAKLKDLNLKLKEDPNNLKLRYQRASVRSYLENTTLALNDFKKAEKKILKISKTKKVPEKILGSLYDHLANIYQGYEMHNHCIQYKLKALKASPKESRLYYNLGYYLISLKSYRLGIPYLNKAIEMVPNHSFANWSLAAAYTDLEDYKKAMTCVNIAFKNEATLYKRGRGTAERDLRTIRGLLYHKLGDSDKGVADLEEALNINNNNSFAYRNLGVIYYDLGAYNRACQSLQKANDLGYEKIHDRDDLQDYLELSCENVAMIEKDAPAEVVLKTEPILGSKFHNKPYIYPNPTKGVVNIKNLPFEGYHYLVFDYTGKMVLEGESRKTPINMSQFPTGVYILKAIKNNLIETIRFIKE